MIYRTATLVLLIAFFSPAGLFGQPEASWLGPLPDEIQESSGLLLVGGRFVTHNDSGNAPILYELDTASLRIVRRVRVVGVDNRDWEALSEDDNYLYIGDFGNNQGNRRDLRVLRISKADFEAGESVPAEILSFSYEDQEGFGPEDRSDWDAEALIVQGDSLWVFTKQWQQKGTVAYRIPNVPGTHVAERVANYPIGGMVTAAVADPEKGQVLLLAYTAQLQPMLVLVPFPISDSGAPASPEKHLLSIGFAQAEGMVLAPGRKLLVSSEAFANRLIRLPAGIYRLDLEEETRKQVTPPEENRKR